MKAHTTASSLAAAAAVALVVMATLVLLMAISAHRANGLRTQRPATHAVTQLPLPGAPPWVCLYVTADPLDAGSCE